MRKFLTTITALLLSFIIFAQTKKITGVVTDKTTNAPLAGVTVSTKNKTAVTDVNGSFSIDASIGDKLTLSYVGTKPLKVVIDKTENLSIRFEPGVSKLNDVVVTGYQAQRKADLTGSVSVVDLKDLKNTPSSNPMQALQGKVPGLYVESSGVPNGASRRVLIRGLNTLGDATPLYIIDGVPTKRAQVFSSLNPNSIASIQVLKDASASSIYGSRASNGVIIVTTKEGQTKGAQEKINIQYSSSLSVQTEKPWRENVLNAEERGRVLWRAAVNDKTNPTVHKAIYTYDWNGDYNNPILNKVNIVP